MNKIIKKFQYGKHAVELETGQIARQASGSVLVRMGDTVVLVAVVGKKNSAEGRDFFPLTVNYQEKFYAVGKIPGSYFKREARPTEKETLVSRLIDRPLRPLFPKGFRCDVQVVATVMSMDPEVSTEIPALIGASAALAISGIPFNGPIAAARVGYVEGEYTLNPSVEDITSSQLDLVVAGTEDAVLMVESEANQLSEDIMLGAVMFGHDQMQVAIQAIKELAEESGAGGRAWDWQAPAVNEALHSQLMSLVGEKIQAAYQIHDKMARQDSIAQIKQEAVEQLCGQEEAPSEKDVVNMIHDIESTTVRKQILEGEPRIDGRDTTSIRPITIEVGVLPRAHGSALFTRGETQAIVVTTLGTARDAQSIEDLDGDRKDDFLLHYNFPPYSVGETGMMTGPKRREIGHGKLAKRAMNSVVKAVEDFPYVYRVVSEITESNGSSSMASVCGSSLSMMDAGVPLKSPVAGIAMGLIKEDNKFAILSDILGDEDHLGDMDFKVAGTEHGITALQMDIKIDGITKDIMQIALDQAKEGRLHILGIMNEVLPSARTTISKHAPSIITIKINPDKIRDVIGKGGATIRELTESTNSTIDITDDGEVKIASVNNEDGQEALRRIKALTEDVEVGKTYAGKVVKIMDFGGFVEILPGKQGLVHVSQICEERVENVRDYLAEGQSVRVKVVEIDRQGRVRLTMREVEPAEQEQEQKQEQE